jgi:ribosomal protein L17
MFLHAKEAYKILDELITFSKSGSFNAAKKDLVNKGTKAMYEVLKKGRLHNLSIQ